MPFFSILSGINPWFLPAQTRSEPASERRHRTCPFRRKCNLNQENKRAQSKTWYQATSESREDA
jgi:hypothetical protein